MSWLFWYCVISHCIFTLILYKLTENVTSSALDGKKIDEAHKAYLESSIWCYGRNRNERSCKFKNLYYSTFLKEYIFFHGKSSIIQGMPDKRCDPALLDLSSVKDHNMKYFNYQDAPIFALKNFSRIFHIHQASLLFHRFNPENIMHVIHDDLLPLFYTLRHHFQDFQENQPFNMDIQLIFMEAKQEGPYFDLYKLFSNRKPILFADLPSKDNYSLVCFNEVTVGISKATTWYDYGFKSPQAPIPNHTADGDIIQQFTEHVTNKLGTSKKNAGSDSGYVILFSRESNRLILNELELTFAIATTFNLRVVRLSLEANKLVEIIEQIQGSVGIIGMHGSILVLSMFLRPSCFVVELFPFAVNPRHYTPYKKLAEILSIRYASWQNKIKNNTVVYPNRTKYEGGIMHLDKKMQTDILYTYEIPRHLCCDNPYWLFRIYQDTIVNIPSFIKVMTATSSGTTILPKFKYVKKYPGKIKEVFCKKMEIENGAAMFVSWTPPWNMQFYNASEVSFEVWIHDILDDEYMAYSLQGVTEHTFVKNIRYNRSCSIWIRGIIRDNNGPFSDLCTC